MANIQIFYDYECPFCKRGYEYLTELLPAYPGIEIEWRPIEAHPRPETYGIHTDLCIQAFYLAEELGADINAFSRAMFQAVVAESRDVEKPETLAEILTGIVDGGRLLETLKSGKYAAKVNENNDLAYEKNGVWYLPAFRVPGNDALRLDAKGGMGVTQEEIKGFLETVSRKSV